jgi:hypothetical protein
MDYTCELQMEKRWLCFSYWKTMAKYKGIDQDVARNILEAKYYRQYSTDNTMLFIQW